MSGVKTELEEIKEDLKKPKDEEDFDILETKSEGGQEEPEKLEEEKPDFKLEELKTKKEEEPKPKKKNDKLTEIMATKSEEKEISSSHSSVNPRSPTRKQVPRHVGAQKLRNMIKLRNHFDGASTSTTDPATSSSLQKYHQNSL